MDPQKIKNTILLPKTDFPIKDVNRQETEKNILEQWQDQRIYQKILKNNQNNSAFILHDGPPYANGNIHLGHVVNKVLKDIILRFYASHGFYTPFILGWDTHGLPIEHKILQLFSGKEVNIRQKCSEHASQQIELQKKQLKQLGLFTEYNKFYITKDKHYKAQQIRVFADLVRKNLIYRSWRPIYWSCSHETALAENEIEYFYKKDYSLYFYLDIVNKKDILGVKNINLLVWTTQPWTIPANQLVAVKKEAKYSLVEWNEKYFFILTEKINKIPWLKDIKIVTNDVSGSELIGLKYRHPYQEQLTGKVIDGEGIVSEEEGTGILHCAPAFGAEDFSLAKREKLTITCPLNEQGYFTNEINVTELIGEHYQKANDWVVSDLSNRQKVAYQSELSHSYPHDWRDKKPLIYRLTEQWFINIQAIKENLLSNIEKVKWYPNWAKNKMQQIISSRDDWCISRQRKWGVPIPVLFKNGKPLLIPEIIDHIADIFETSDSDCWFNNSILLQLKAKFPQLISKDTKLGTDIMDVWFDSGVSHWCVLKKTDCVSNNCLIET